jgi:ribosomal protein S18 acetylase RimI-like enzyme
MRPLVPADVPEVGRVLLAAYRGTVDDEGETEDDAIGEIERTTEGQYGPFLPAASFVVEDDDRIAGASLVSLVEDRPCLLYVVVHPDVQRRGLGGALISASGNALMVAGHRELDLFVTEANEPAVALYRKLGFEQVERMNEPPP